MSNVLCLIRRHDWLRRRDTTVDARGGVHQVCRRCGRERIRYPEPGSSGVVHFGNGVG